jgi:N-methylhydantoinase A
MRQPVLLGVDVGGTFTDAVLAAGGRLCRAKLPTTADQSEGVLAAALEVLAKAALAPGEVTGFSHGMTTATNALLERKGALTAAVTTAGFQDILEIGRQNRPRLYDLCPQRPEPLVPCDMRFTVNERVSAAGEIEPLSLDEMRRVAAELRAWGEPEATGGPNRRGEPGQPGERQLAAVAVCLLFSFLDPTHERELADVLRRELPGVHVSISSEVLPQFREYERFSTTAVDAYLTPVVAKYLERLGEETAAAGLPEPAIMQSSGGVLPLDRAASSAAPLLLSGPAAGVVGAVFAAGRSGVDSLIAFDMGGTSTDVTLVRDGAAEITTEREIGGSPVALPMVDIHTIGAGGGSIAWIDAGGALRVGPESAGAAPGPACYGMGGEWATVTDANLFLGYLGERLGGDGLALMRDLAETALAQMARLLGMSLEETAMGIRRVANAGMVKAVRVISVERGHDPRRFVLVAFGGAGPMHGADLAVELGISRVILPDSCGVLSALGMVVGDQRRDWVRTVYRAGEWDDRSLEEAFAGLEREANVLGTRFIRHADLRYRGQSHELTVELGAGNSRDELAAAFEREHEKAYGYLAKGEPVELVNVRLTALTPLERPELGAESAGGGIPAVRPAFFEGGWTEAQVWERPALGMAKVPGPAVIEEGEATTVVPPGWTVRRDDVGNLWMERDVA